MRCRIKGRTSTNITDNGNMCNRIDAKSVRSLGAQQDPLQNFRVSMANIIDGMQGNGKRSQIKVVLS
jgi:hypothetical protein